MQMPKSNVCIGMRQLDGILFQSGNRRTKWVGSDQRNLLIPKCNMSFKDSDAKQARARRVRCGPTGAIEEESYVFFNPVSLDSRMS